MSERLEKESMGNADTQALVHSKAVLLGLNELRRADKLLDITLLVEGISIKAHRVVLSACSDYFCAMFTDPMKEARQSEIKLLGVTARGIQILIEYAYTSNLNLDRDNIQDILSAATYVQMNAVVSACSTYLESQIDLENCVDIATLADLYSLEKLKNKTYRFICSRLEEFSKTPDVINISPKQLEYLLSSDFPVDCTEIRVLQIVAEYCVKKKIRPETSMRLFQKVRFNQLKDFDLRVWPRFEYVDEAVHSKYYQVMRMVGSQQKNEFKKMIGYADMCATPNPNVLTNSRGMELALVKIGGFHVNGLHNKLSFAIPGERKWHSLTSIPHIEQINYGTAVLGNDLFVVGGSYDVCLKEYIHGFGFRYSAANNQWETIAPIQSDRCRFSLNAVGKHLYAVGGNLELVENVEENWPYGRQVPSCERYNATTDSWEFIEPLKENRSQHAGASHGRYLYISGGIDRHLVLSSFHRYDTINDKWLELRPMLKPRADHVLVVINDMIYACGGWYESPHNETRILLGDIDVYDIHRGIWTFVARNPVPTFHAGITAVKSKIFFVGGLLGDENINGSSHVQSYDVMTKQWSTHTEWEDSEAIWECTCATFYVPQCRDGI